MALNHSFAGKRILVTGGGQGIGRQLVQRFHDDGAIVFAIDKNPETIAELKKTLPNVTAEVVDVGDWKATRKMVESFGVIDHLVNNAGMGILQKFMEITEEAALTQINVNLMSIVNISQVVAKGLIEAGRGGSIVNVASVLARFATSDGNGIYGVTKAGVENLTKSMAIDLGPHNIRVNSIAPAMVDTNMLPRHNMDFILNYRMVNKRLVTTDEVADLILYLLSPLSSSIVGESVLIDGGMMTC